MPETPLRRPHLAVAPTARRLAGCAACCRSRRVRRSRYSSESIRHSASPVVGLRRDSDDRNHRARCAAARRGARPTVALVRSALDGDHARAARRAWGSALHVGRSRFDRGRGRARGDRGRGSEFLAHRGFDFKSIDRALDDRMAGEALRGASTISQQVAKNLFLWPGRSSCARASRPISLCCWRRSARNGGILEIYLNVAELGPGAIRRRSRGAALFSTGAATLTAPQAALLAAVCLNPRQLRAAAEPLRAQPAGVGAGADAAARSARPLPGLEW